MLTKYIIIFFYKYNKKTIYYCYYNSYSLKQFHFILFNQPTFIIYNYSIYFNYGY